MKQKNKEDKCMKQFICLVIKLHFLYTKTELTNEISNAMIEKIKQLRKVEVAFFISIFLVRYQERFEEKGKGTTPKETVSCGQNSGHIVNNYMTAIIRT